MSDSDQLADDLKDLEPPASVEKIVRFLKALTANNGAELHRITHPAARLVSLRTEAFADQIAAKSMSPGRSAAMQPFQSLVANYSVRVEELDQFIQWLNHFQHQLPELEANPPIPPAAPTSTNDDTDSPSRVRRRGQSVSEDDKDLDGASPRRNEGRHPDYDNSPDGDDDKDYQPERRGSAPVRNRVPEAPANEPLDLKPFLQRSARNLIQLNAIVGAGLLGSEMAPGQTVVGGGNMTQVVQNQILAPFVPRGWVPASPNAQPMLLGPQIGSERAFAAPSAFPASEPVATPTSGIDFSTLTPRGWAGISKGMNDTGPPESFAPAGSSSFAPTGGPGDFIHPEDIKTFQPPLAGVNEPSIANELRSNPALLRSVVQDVGPERMGVAMEAPGTPGAPGRFGIPPDEERSFGPGSPFSAPGSPAHGFAPPAMPTYAPGGIPADEERFGPAEPNSNPFAPIGYSPRGVPAFAGGAIPPDEERSLGSAPASFGAPKSIVFGSTAHGAPAFAGGAIPPDEERSQAPNFTPEHAQLTIIAPPLTVASPESAAAGSGVQMDWSSLAATAGTLTPSGLADIVSALPPGAQAIYPGLPANRMAPGAFSLNLGPSVLGHLLGSAYGPGAAAHAPTIAGKAPTSPPAPGKVQASLVPLQRPAGNATGLVPSKGDPSGPGALGQAGGAASRNGPLGFLGLPVRVAPSLGASPALKNEVAVRGAAADVAANRAVSPDKFNLLKSRVMPSINSMDVEPNKQAWAKAAPNFGLKSADPISILSPQARQPAPSASGPTPSSTQTPSPQGGRMPFTPMAPGASTPHASPPIHPPMLGRAPASWNSPPTSAPATPNFTTSPPASPNDPRRLPTHLPPVRHSMPGAQISPGAPNLPMSSTPPGTGSSRGYNPPPIPTPTPPGTNSTPSRTGISSRSFVPGRTPMTPRTGPAIGTQRRIPTRIQQQPSSRPSNSRTPAGPDMLYAAPPSAPPSRFAIQKASGGDAPFKFPEPSGSESHSGADQGGGVNDAANVDLLASEVWSLLKHRIKIESDRRGRW